MKIKVGEKEFTLTKKNLRMRNLFQEMVNLSSDLSIIAEDAQEYADNASFNTDGDKPSPADFIRKRREMRRGFRELDVRRRENTEAVNSKREELLRLILEKNGYSYDRDFWLDEADIEDVNDIVIGMFRGKDSGKE